MKETKMHRLFMAIFLLLSYAAYSNQGPGGVGNRPLLDTIAYVTGDGDEIRLIDPDGSNNRRLWAHGYDDPNGVYEIWSMSWKPDATELAFASTHEDWCSLNDADIFVVGAGGEAYRRITQAPACAELANYPKGTVHIPVQNRSSLDTFFGFLYFQGAPSVQQLSLPPSGTGIVTFEDVADLGDGETWLQLGTVIYGNNREVLFSTLVDVLDGGVVTTNSTEIFVPTIYWEAYAPTWRADGSKLGFVYNGNSLYQLDPHPQPLEFGTRLLAEGASVPNVIANLAWGPTSETANQLLHTGFNFSAFTGIYLTREGSTAVGEPLVSYTSTEFIYGLAWLPDGSGFVYSVTEGDYFSDERSSNLFVYDFASGTATRVTSLTGDFAGQVSVSPDGETFVFERAADLNDTGSGLREPDLWLVSRDGSGLRLLVENAYAPAWSW